MNPNQPPYHPPGKPPVPRDHDEATMSEIMPFRSSKISLIRSPLTVLLGLTAILGPLMFTAVTTMVTARTPGDQAWAYQVTTIVGVFTAVLLLSLVIYFYARPGRPVWSYLWPFGVVAAILAIGPVSQAFFFIFRNVLPGNVAGLTEQSGFLAQFIAMFFGAGLCEELMKGVPMLIGAAVGIAASRRAGPLPWAMSFFRVRGPLDGAVMGIFAGAGFIFMETAFEYVPDRAAMIAQATRDQGFGWTFGLQLLLPRVFTGMVGHMGWSAIFGYFIGLAVLRRRHMVPLILGGWVAASFIHGLWNSISAISPHLTYAVAGITAILAAAVILKARQLNQTMYGDQPETMGSIIIDRSGAGGGGAPQPAPYPGYPPQPYPGQPGAAPAHQPFAGYPPQPHPAAPYSPPGAPTFANPAAAAPQPFQPYVPPPAAAAEQSLAIDIEGLLIPIRAGVAIDLGAEPALDGRGAGVRADVVPHPSRPGVLGLRNSGNAAWSAHLRDGRTQQIERDQNVRMAAGVRLEFGGGLVGNVVARG